MRVWSPSNEGEPLSEPTFVTERSTRKTRLVSGRTTLEDEKWLLVSFVFWVSGT